MPGVFCCPAPGKIIYLRLLLDPLRDRYQPIFVEDGGLPEAIATLEAGLPALLHVHWEEFFFLNIADPGVGRQIADSTIRDLSRFRDAGGRIVWTIHNAIPHTICHVDLFLEVRRHLARVAHVVLVHNLTSIEVLRSQVGEVTGTIELLPHPSYEGRYEPAGTAARILAEAEAPDRLVLGFGRMESRKGFAWMIDALPPDFLAEQQARVVIAGGGRFGRELKQGFPERSDIGWKLHFIPDEELGPLFRRAACLVLPYERFLTSGIALLALTLGAVIVAREAPQFTELVPEPARRFLYRAGDASDFRRAIAEVLALTPDESRAIRQAGLELAARFDPEVIAARLGAIYDDQIVATTLQPPPWEDQLAGFDLVGTPPRDVRAVLAVWPDDALHAGNWGDKLNPVLISLLSGRRTLHERAVPSALRETVYRVVGSGLGSAGADDVVWGSGFIRSNAPVPNVRAVHAVRGPLTRAHLLEGGVGCPRVYGDPALLMPLFYRPPIEPEWDLGVIRHFRDAKAEPVPRVPDGMRVKAIDITGSITGVIDEILSCRQIASSSLHGLIVAHAYGVPATWIKYGDRPLGDDFKFRDYWASMGWSRAEPIRVGAGTSCGDLVGPLARVRPLVDIPALIAACPFVDPDRKQALLRRAAEALPALPDVSFLAAARPDPAVTSVKVRTPRAKGGRPLLSVLIAADARTLNPLEATLRSIREGNAGARMEILVGETGHGKEPALEALAARFGGRLLAAGVGAWNRAQALNAAALEAKASFVVIGDAGMLFAPRSLVALAAHLDALPDAVHLLRGSDLPPEMLAEETGPESPVPPPLPWKTLAAGSRSRPEPDRGCVACSAALFAGIRGLDEHAGDEAAMRDFLLRCRRHGFPVHGIEQPDAAVYRLHPVPSPAPSQAGTAPEGDRSADPRRAPSLQPGSPWRMRDPLVSVVIVARDHGRRLRECLASVLAQTVQDFEIVVVHGGATDRGATDAIAGIVASFADPRLRIARSKEPGNLAAARNEGNRQARGTYIAVQDDDGLMLPGRLERQVAAIEPGSVGSYGGWVDFGGAEEDHGVACHAGSASFELGSLMFGDGRRIHHSLMLHRDVCLRHPYDEGLSPGADTHLLTRLTMAGYRLDHCRAYATLRRIDAGGGRECEPDNALRIVRGAVLGFIPAAAEEDLRARGRTAPMEIAQPGLAGQIAGLLDERCLSSVDELPYDAELVQVLRARKLAFGIRLVRVGRRIDASAILLEGGARVAYADALDARHVARGPVSLRGRLRAVPFRSGLIARHVGGAHACGPRRAPTSIELDFCREAGGRVGVMQFHAVEWPGMSKLFLPSRSQEPAVILFTPSGAWSLLLGLADAYEFSLRAVIAASRYPSLRVQEWAEEGTA